MLPTPVTKLGSFKGDKGRPGTFDSADAVAVPAGSPAEAIISGPEGEHVTFKIPRGLPGTNAVANDVAFAEQVAAVDSQTRAALVSAFGTPRQVFVHPDGNDGWDGKTWDQAKKTIAAAVSALGSAPGTITLADDETYAITDTVTIAYPRHTLRGGIRTKIDAAAVVDKPAVRVIGAADGLYLFGNNSPLRSFEIVGPGSGSEGSVGVAFEDPTGTDVLNSTGIYDLNVHDFEVGFRYGRQTFGITLYNCAAWFNAVCVDVPPLPGGVFERLAFVGCMLFNSGIAVRARQGLTGMHLTNCSLDYCDVLVHTNGTKVFLTDCHMEVGASLTSNHALPRTTPFFEVGSHPESMLVIRGGVIHLDNSHGISPVIVPSVVGNYGGQVLLDGVTVSRFDTEAGVFADGEGFTVLRDMMIATNATGYPSIAQQKRSLVPSTEVVDSVDIVDPWYVTENASYTSRLVGSDTSIEASTEAHTGTRSVKINKGPSTVNGSATLFVPVEAGSMVSLDMWVKVTGAGTGSFPILTGFASNVLLGTNPQSVVFSGWTVLETITKNAGDVAWMRVRTDAPIRVPGGATHWQIRFGLWATPNVNVHIDEVNVSHW